MQTKKILWLCGVPMEFQEVALKGRNVGSHAAWSWVMGHLPPPPGIELHIACPAKYIEQDMELEYRGAVFHLFPYPRGAAYTLFKSWLPGFKRVFKKVRPDWIHGWGTEAGFSSSALSLSRNRSIVGIQGIISDYHPFMHKSIALRLNLLNEKRTLTRAKHLVAESQYSAAKTKQYTRGNVQIVRHPLRSEFLNSPVGNRDNNQLIFLGAFNDGKGAKDAIKAFAKIACSGWSLLCIGRGKPYYEAELRQLVLDLGLDAQVEFRSGLSAEGIISLFQESPVFLLPTSMDTGPTALKEALAMGVWPICYDNSGPRELINHYGFGTLVETGNVELLGDVLTQVVMQKPWRSDGAVESCVKQIRHDLSPDTIWQELVKCYTDECWK